MQPHFLPFAGYFDLMRQVDCFVYYDTAQFRRRSWQCRTLLPSAGVARWVSAPVATPTGSRQPIASLCWDDTHSWRDKLARRLRYDYPAGVLLDAVIAMVRTGPAGLADWNITVNDWLAAAVLRLEVRTLRASALPVRARGRMAQLVSMCVALGATEYVGTPGARGYLNQRAFEEVGIRIRWMDYRYSTVPNAIGQPMYPSILHQLLGKGLAVACGEVGCAS